jgi:hypothetical protein
MTEHWTDRLSEYVDEDESFDAASRAAIAAHLAACSECAAIADDLVEIKTRSQALDDRPPQADLWTGIAARIGVERPDTGSAVVADTGAARAPRRYSLSLAQIAAAAALLVAVSGGTAWMLRGRTAAPVETARLDGPRDEGGAVPVANFADAQYDAAVADLQNALEAGRGRLDRETIAILERNLAVIDGAIEQARAALESDPSNVYLNSHLADARRRKLALLRRVAALADPAS